MYRKILSSYERIVPGHDQIRDAEKVRIRRAETMVCFTAFSLKADQMPIFGLLLVFFLLKSLHFMNFPQNDD